MANEMLSLHGSLKAEPFCIKEGNRDGEDEACVL